MNRELISTVLGFLSIGSWLCAQLPQLYTNWKNASVEGLALPFLLSWLGGDATNLIGCILTHQLPFQTNLATYFVLVDIGLMSQWIYYTSKNGSKPLPPLNAAHPHLHSREHSRRTETWPRDPSRSTIKAIRSSSRKKHALANGVIVVGAKGLEGSWMSEARGRSAPRETRTLPNDPSYPSSAQTSYPNSTHYEESPPSPVIPLPERGRTLNRPPTLRSNLEAIAGSPSNLQSPPLDHYHSEASEEGYFAERILEGTGRGKVRSKSRTRQPPPTRRSTSMVFLSVGVLFTFAKWSGSKEFRNGNGEMDIAWSNKPIAVSNQAVRQEWSNINYLRNLNHFPPSNPSTTNLRKREFIPNLNSTIPPGEDYPDDDEPDWERILGRASAWLCTTLYLTSRMPQIWKNFRRRSVEGLSMLLFIMAFVGNSFYVLSILTNPLASTPGYLLESTPYLLGSGGTLCFDLAIVTQSFLYSEKRKDSRERRRRGKGIEDEEALLDPDGLEYEDDNTTNPGTQPSSRNVSRNVSRSVSIHSRNQSKKNRKSNSTELSKQKDLESINSGEFGMMNKLDSRRVSLEMVGEAGESAVVL